MNYLLDTHVILWIAFEQQKINPKVQDILLSKDNNLFISSVSFWEISLKVQSGKLNLKTHSPESLIDGFKHYFASTILDLSIKDAVTFHHLKQAHHKDPFDRMLIWQALTNKLTFITDDEQIHKYKDAGLKVLW